MRPRLPLVASLFAVLLALGALSARGAQALVPAPAWSAHSLATPTVFESGDESGLDLYEVMVTNSGGAPTDKSPITITDTLPKGLGVKSIEFSSAKKEGAAGVNLPGACKAETAGEVATVTCEITEALPGVVEPALLYPSEEMRVVIHLEVSGALTGPLSNRVEVEGGGAESAGAESDNEASAEVGAKARAGFQYFDAELLEADGSLATGADSHPYQYVTSFAVNAALSPKGATLPFVPAGGDLKDIEVALPPGLIANPRATPRCTAQQFNTFKGSDNECPEGSAVGFVVFQQLEGAGEIGPHPIYSLVPPKGMPAQFGFVHIGLPFYIDTRLRSDDDYGVSGFLADATQAKRVTAASLIFWGTPADASHDRLRGHCLDPNSQTSFSFGECPAETPVKPSFRLPSSCADPLQTTMSFDTWLKPGAFVSALFSEAAPIGCELPDFSPTIEAEPTTNVADAPSGLHFDLHSPQAANEDPEGLGEADLRDATVTLPEGLLPNPAFADGLAACSRPRSATRASKKAGRRSPPPRPNAPTHRRSARSKSILPSSTIRCRELSFSPSRAKTPSGASWPSTLPSTTRRPASSSSSRARSNRTRSQASSRRPSRRASSSRSKTSTWTSSKAPALRFAPRRPAANSPPARR